MATETAPRYLVRFTNSRHGYVVFIAEREEMPEIGEIFAWFDAQFEILDLLASAPDEDFVFVEAEFRRVR